MLSAILHGKAGRVEGADDEPRSYRDLFRASEDLLTATVLERLAYLEAADFWNQALERDPGYAYAFDGLGRIAAKKGHWDEAVIHYRKALAIRPELLETHQRLGEILLKLGRLEETADIVAIGPIEVEGGPPRRAVSFGEIGPELGQVVAFRAEVVVDHVQHDRQP